MKVFHIIAYSQESDKLWFQDSFKCVSNEKTYYAAIHVCLSPSNTRLCPEHWGEKIYNLWRLWRPKNLLMFH